MTEDGPYCAVKYCRVLAAAGKKYCPKHDGMGAKEVLEEEKKIAHPLRTIGLEWGTIEALVAYALEDILRKAKKGKG